MLVAFTEVQRVAKSYYLYVHMRQETLVRNEVNRRISGLLFFCMVGFLINAKERMTEWV
jgi:hypothetical protein